MGTRLLLILLAVVAWLFLRRSLRSARPTPSRRRTGPQPSEGPGTAMVRDRVCDTFVPRNRALAVSEGSKTHYFCSEACRDRFLTARSS